MDDSLAGKDGSLVHLPTLYDPPAGHVPPEVVLQVGLAVSLVVPRLAPAAVEVKVGVLQLRQFVRVQPAHGVGLEEVVVDIPRSPCADTSGTSGRVSC